MLAPWDCPSLCLLQREMGLLLSIAAGVSPWAVAGKVVGVKDGDTRGGRIKICSKHATLCCWSQERAWPRPWFFPDVQW